MRNRFLGFGCGIGSGAESDPLENGPGNFCTDFITSQIMTHYSMIGNQNKITKLSREKGNFCVKISKLKITKSFLCQVELLTRLQYSQ